MKTVELKTSVIQAIIKSHQSNQTMSLREFATFAGLSPALLSLVCSGKKTRVKEKSALGIAKSLGVDPETIIKDFGGGHLSTQQSTTPCCETPSSRSGTPYPQRPPAPSTTISEEA